MIKLIISIALTHLTVRLMQYMDVSDFISGWVCCSVFSFTIIPFINECRNVERIKESKNKEPY